MNKGTLNQKIINSKFKISKNFVYFICVPLLAMILAIILLFTVGFNAGTDFTGGTTFKVYVNNEGTFQTLDQYDLNKKEDYTKVYNKIKTVLTKNNLKIVSYQTTTMDLTDYHLLSGQAVEVQYRNNAKGDDIQIENDLIKNQIIEAFNYDDVSLAVSSFDQTTASSYSNFSIKILASILVSLIAIEIYLLLRKYRGFALTFVMQCAVDLLLSLSLFMICRTVVNLSIGIAILTAFVLSIINCFAFAEKTRHGFKTNKFVKKSNNEIADMITKEMLLKKTIIYACLIVISILFICCSTQGIRELSLNMLIVLLASFYTSTLLLPSFWATFCNVKKLNQKTTKRL